jgi:hypothetical protein
MRDLCIFHFKIIHVSIGRLYGLLLGIKSINEWNEKLRTVIFGMHYIRFEWNMVKEKAVSRINK